MWDVTMRPISIYTIIIQPITMLANVVVAYTVRAYIVMAYIMMTYIVMAYTVRAYGFNGLSNYGSHGSYYFFGTSTRIVYHLAADMQVHFLVFLFHPPSWGLEELHLATAARIARNIT